MQGKTTKKHDKNGQIAFFKIFELFILIIWAKDVPLKYLSPNNKTIQTVMSNQKIEKQNSREKK